MEETVKCLECGRDFKAITNTHLKSHGMALDQYREKYPGAHLLAEKVYDNVLKAQRKGADALRGLERPDYVKVKISKTVSDTVCDPEWRKAQSDRMYQYYEDHPEIIEKFKGLRPYLCGDANPAKRSEVRKKISESKLGDKNSSKRPEVRKKIADSVNKLYEDPEYKARFQGENNPMFGRTGADNPNYGRKVTFEDRIRQSCIMRGISIDDFDGFVSENKYCDKWNERIRKIIRDLYDNCDYFSGIPDYVCNVLKGKVYKLDVHHVDSNKMQGCDDHKWKLVPLSRSNHVKTNINRAFWERLICYALEYDETYYNDEIKDIYELGD